MRTLGLDLGINSIGWALIEGKKNNVKIIDLGVRKFTAGQAIEQGKIVGPPALPRREARSSRRTIRRKKARLTKIKQLLKNYKLIESEKSLFYNKKMLDVWLLRSAAVNGKLLSAEEFARILIHIAKHRGYMSSFNDEDIEENNNDKYKIKKAISKTEKEIKELNYQTYGEYVYKESNNTCMRNRQNKDGKADYKYFPTLSLLKNEIDIIFEKQIKLWNKYALNQLKNEYWEITSSFKEPKSLENMVGYCTFFKKEKRAPKHSYLAERFVLLTSIFNTIVIDKDFNETKIINIKPLKDIVEFAYKYDSVTYKQLRNFLSIDDKTKFKGINYDKKRKTDPESNKFVNLQGFNVIKKICGEEIASNKDLSLKITQILSYYKSVNQRTAELSEIKELNVDMINALVKLENIDGFINLSAKAVDIILTYMETGLRYDEAVKKAQDNGKLLKEEILKQDLLPPLNKTDIFITNPTVLRALSETRKVINAAIRKYGPLDNINIELAREIKTKKEKQRYLQAQYKNKDNKTQAEKLLKQIGINNPSSKNILKARLYIQQSQQNGKCICLYSGEIIELGKLLDEGYYQIDHILPKSRSMDDSFNNKVLCIAKENQEKGNKLPYEWLNEQRFEIFKKRVLSMKDTLGYRKVSNLLVDKINTEGFIERNLNDTRYISRTCKKYLETYLKIGKDDNTIKVHAINGILTSELRHKWGLKDKDRGNDEHHAEDAVIIALTNSSMVNKLSNYYKELESRKHPVFPKPFKLFDQVLNKKLNKLPKNKILVSRPPRKKVTGAAHKETVISPKKKNDSMVRIHNGNGYAEQALMPRLDVFKKEGKYYYVPIYVADFAQNELPNKIITPGKKKSEWDILDDKYEFLFSLYKNDLIEVKQKDKDKIIGYYQKININGSQITYQNIDGSKNINGKGENIDPYFGGKTLEYLKKYQVDPLGFYYEIKKELRLPINNKKNINF